MGIDYSIKRKGNTAEISLFPKQQAFIQSECDEVFFGGAAGPGKSYALLIFCLKRRLEFSKTKGLLLRRKFPELERSLIQNSREIYPMFGARYNSQNHKWTFPNGSVQEFGHMEHEHTVHDYQSAEYNDICFDESSHFTEFQIRYMLSRLRTSRPDCKSLFRLASNPGGVSHGFLKRRYVMPYKQNKIWEDHETGHKLTFIPARLRDNPALMENDPGYEKRLRGLPEKQRRALLDGDWDVFEGQFFNEWNENLHVLRRSHNVSPNTQKIISVDWGYASHAAVYWTEITPTGRIFTYRELYVSLRAPKQLGQDILDLTPPEEQGFIGVYLPPEVFGKKVELEDGGVPIADLMGEVLQQRFVVAKANNARIAGWTKMREYMGTAPDGLPWWQIDPSCKNLIRTIPDMIYDETHVEDMNCFVAGTKIITIHGEKNIEDIENEDLVLTPIGWRKVLHSGISGYGVVIEINFSNGKKLKGTPNHKIYVRNKGLVELQYLKKYDTLQERNTYLWKTKKYGTTGFVIRGGLVGGIMNQMEHLFQKGIQIYIDKFGWINMAPFQMVFMYTIKTIIQITTPLRIWNWSMPVSMHGTTQKNVYLKTGIFLSNYENGEEVGPENAFSNKMHKKCWNTLPKENLRASIVEKLLKHDIRRKSIVEKLVRKKIGLIFLLKFVRFVKINFPIVNILIKKFKPVHIVAVGCCEEKETVYNLTVEEAHLYYANGVVVTNTDGEDHPADAIRYGLMAINQVPKNILSPHGVMSNIFAPTQNRQLASHTPMPGRSGYGF